MFTFKSIDQTNNNEYIVLGLKGTESKPEIRERYIQLLKSSTIEERSKIVEAHKRICHSSI